MSASIELADLQSSLAIDAAAFRELIERAVALTDYGGTLSIALVDDERMRQLHRDYMGIDEPTDVLAFPLDESCGEVVISTDTARVNAAERDAPPELEVLLYAIHGLLHLLGHDDHAAADRTRMQAEERRILGALGFPRPD